MIKRIPFLSVVIFAVVTAFTHPTNGGMFPYTGNDPKVAAGRIVRDLKFGANTVKRAIELGDPVIPHIVEQSEDFKLLNDRNGRWVAEVLGSIDTELSRETLLKMYRHERSLVRFVGAIGLAMQKKLPQPLDDDSFLIQKVKNAKFEVAETLDGEPDPFALPGEPQIDDETYLAIIALGYAGGETATLALQTLVEKEPEPYFDRGEVFLAFARIRNPKFTGIIRKHFSEFGGVEQFRILICLGDKQVVPIAFEHLGDKRTDTLVREVEFVTGHRFGVNKQRWRNWWKEHGDEWTIPDIFRAPWDEQPEDPRFVNRGFFFPFP